MGQGLLCLFQWISGTYASTPTAPRCSHHQTMVVNQPIEPYFSKYPSPAHTSYSMPYQLANPISIVHLDHLSHQYPVDIVICHCLCLTNSVQPSTLSTYSAGLLRFTKFCNDIGIPESECMPASESLLSHFIVSHGATSVGKGTMWSWLEGLHLWHQINETPWNGSHMLRKFVMSASKFSPAESKHDK